MFKELDRTKKNPFLLGFPARHKQSPRRSAVNDNRNFHYFERINNKDGRKTHRIKSTNKSNGKTPKTCGKFLPQHFSRSSSNRKIGKLSSFSKRKVCRGINKNCFSGKKNFLFSPILAEAYKDQGNFGSSEEIWNSLAKNSSPRKSPLIIPFRESQKSLM